MENGINVVSCFDGISCGQIALNILGFKVNNYFAFEIDKGAIKVCDQIKQFKIIKRNIFSQRYSSLIVTVVLQKV